MARWMLPILLLAIAACSGESDSTAADTSGSGDVADTSSDGSSSADGSADGSGHTDPPGTRALLDTAALPTAVPFMYIVIVMPSLLTTTWVGTLGVTAVSAIMNAPT